jgi:DNA repair ATPase RecN
MLDPLDDSIMQLQISLDGAQNNTKEMLSRLDRFEKRLNNLDNKVAPIRETTTKYSRAQENIAAVITEVKKTYEYFKIAKQVGGIIESGLKDPREFFLAIERLTSAKKFFEEHRGDIKSSVQALKAVDLLLKVSLITFANENIQCCRVQRVLTFFSLNTHKTAITTCADELERLLLSCGKAVELIDGSYKVNMIRNLSCDIPRYSCLYRCCTVKKYFSS